MKKLSIKLAILVPSLAVLVAGILAMVVIVGAMSSATTNNITDRLVDARVSQYANEFRALSVESYGAVAALAPIVQNFAVQNGGDGDRAAVRDVLEDALSSNPNIIGVWTCWEPNAFDGRDAEYVDAEGADGTGRLIYSVYRDGAGYGLEALADYDSSDYYTGPKSTGKPYVTDPYSYNMGGTETVLYTLSVPVLQNGKTVGVVGADISLQTVNDILNAGSILEDGYVYIISPGGFIASHPNPAVLLEDYHGNWLGAYASDIDGVLANGGLVSMEAYSTQTKENVRFLASGVMIGNTGRYWALCGVVPSSTVTADSTRLVIVVVGIGLALILLVGTVIFLIIRRQLAALPLLTKTADAMAVGDIDTSALPKTEGDTRNEIALLSRAFRNMAEGVRHQSDILEAIAGGDYSMQVEMRSDKDVMNKAISDMLDRTNASMHEIHEAAGQVATGAGQIADSATSLATGSTQQAATVEEFSATIATVESQATATLELAEQVRNDTNKAGELMGQSLSYMDELTHAMKAIDSSSGEIASVIKVIDDIAFQTNILALNAAVEAARAGEHGKGFAVVADEVRNLAGKSAEAAKETAQLIQNSVDNVAKGNTVMEKTAASLDEVGQIAQKNAEDMGQMSEMASQQSSAISEINVGIGQISQVVQANSATAEESAASAEEMSAQSALLDKIVKQFKLRGAQQAGGRPALGAGSGAGQSGQPYGNGYNNGGGQPALPGGDIIF